MNEILRRLATAAFGVLLLASAGTAPASAEDAKPKVPTAVSRDRADKVQNRPWKLEDALPQHDAPRPVARETASNASPPLGRVPLSSASGSFGVETENKINPRVLPDGQRIGPEPAARHEPSYLGLSLTVPTAN